MLTTGNLGLGEAWACITRCILSIYLSVCLSVRPSCTCYIMICLCFFSRVALFCSCRVQCAAGTLKQINRLIGRLMEQLLNPWRRSSVVSRDHVKSVCGSCADHSTSSSQVQLSHGGGATWCINTAALQRCEFTNSMSTAPQDNTFHTTTTWQHHIAIRAREYKNSECKHRHLCITNELTDSVAMLV